MNCVWMTREGQEHIQIWQRFNWLKFDIFTLWCRILMKSVGHWIVENFRICSLCLLSGTLDISNIHVCVCTYTYVYLYVFIYLNNMNERQVIWSKMNFVRIEAITWLVCLSIAPFRIEGRSPAPDRVSLLKKIRWKQCYEFKFNWRLKLKSIDNNYVYLFFLYYVKNEHEVHTHCCYCCIRLLLLLLVLRRLHAQWIALII